MFLSLPSFAAGFATGFGTGVMTREVMRISNAAFRPVAKAVIKGGMMAYDKSREAMAVTGETFEDLVAEARADIHPGQAGDKVAASQSNAAAATTTGSSSATQAAPATAAGNA